MAKVESIIRLLIDEVLRAHLYYGVAKALRERSQEQVFEIASNVFSASYYACIRENLLAISKLVIPARESISMEYLFNYSEQNIEEFTAVPPEEVRSLILSSRTDIESLNEFADQMRLLRDGELAHLDRKHINDPKFMIPHPIPFDELEKCQGLLLGILNDFCVVKGLPQVLLDDYYELAKQEVEILLSTLKNYGK